MGYAAIISLMMAVAFFAGTVAFVGMSEKTSINMYIMMFGLVMSINLAIVFAVTGIWWIVNTVTGN